MLKISIIPQEKTRHSTLESRYPAEYNFQAGIEAYAFF